MSLMVITQRANKSGSEKAAGENYLQTYLVQPLKETFGEFNMPTVTYFGALNFNPPLPERVGILVLMNGMVELGLEVNTFDKALSMLRYHVVSYLPESDIFMWLPILLYHVALGQHLGATVPESQQVLEGEILLRSTVILFAMYFMPPMQHFQHVSHIITSKTTVNCSICNVPILQTKLFLAICVTVEGTGNVMSVIIYEDVSEHLYDLQSLLPAIRPDAKCAYELTFLSASNSSGLNKVTQFSPCLAYVMMTPFLHRELRLHHYQRDMAYLCALF